MSLETQVASLLRGQIALIISGSFFLLIGLIAFVIAAIRRRGGARIFVWIGIWSAMFGVNEFLRSPAVTGALPHSLRAASATATVMISYLILVAGTLSFLELSLGKLRRLLQVLLVADLAIAIAGITWLFVYGAGDRFTLYNNLLATFSIVVLLAVLAVPKLARRLLIVSGHRVLTAGTFLFAAQALYANLARPLNYVSPGIYGSVGFAVLLLSFGYTAVEMIVNNERRLLSIEKELDIARQLQFSILPGGAPEIAKLRIAATYLPMSAVAGDFYEFVPVDEHRVGFLVADVSGHGVPAALIASMIKVAMQSAADCAHDPAELLRRLGGILSSHLRGQLVSAAYLWVDTERGTARYSAAGHPPLLLWRVADGVLTAVESNGLLFGVTPNSHYPVREIPLAPGDRHLLYTDGVTEPENAAGEPFGDRKLEQIVSEGRSQPAAELSARLLAGVRAWQPTSVAQQDDITLIAIDVL